MSRDCDLGLNLARSPKAGVATPAFCGLIARNSISFCPVSVQFLSRTQRGLTRGDSRLCHARRHACGCCAMHEVLAECLSETANQLARSRPLHSLTHECLHRRTTMLESMRGCVTDLKWARSRRRSTLLHTDDAYDCDTDSEWPEHAVQRRR